MEETSKKVRQREIKFRALTKDLEGNQYMSYSDRYEEDEIPTSAHTLMSYFFRNLSPDAVLMQYTGLKDITGKDVFEGDVISYDLLEGLGQPARTGLRRAVQITPWGAIGQWDANIKVIGNIYEHPQLLSQGEIKT